MVEKQLVKYSASIKKPKRFEDHFDNFIINAFVSITCTMYNQCFCIAFLLLHVTRQPLIIIVV